MSTLFSEMDDVAKRLAEQQKQRKKIKEDTKKQAQYEERKQHNPLI